VALDLLIKNFTLMQGISGREFELKVIQKIDTTFSPFWLADWVVVGVYPIHWSLMSLLLSVVMMLIRGRVN
jgi:hypothetical protein